MYLGQWNSSLHPGHGGALIQGDGLQAGQRCFYIEFYDAEENSISGSGCWAISNACAYGEAAGMARIAEAVNGSAQEAEVWQGFKRQYRATLTELLWHDKLQVQQHTPDIREIRT
jgi:hypothetical protein